MGEATRFFSGREACGRPVISHVIARHGGDGSKVLCVSHASGEKTLPVFTDRETARRFLRSGSLRFGLLGSGWRVRKTSGEELASLLFGPRAVVCRVMVDPSPETLVGDRVATPTTANALELPPWSRR